jgi:hypothetical protein
MSQSHCSGNSSATGPSESVHRINACPRQTMIGRGCRKTEHEHTQKIVEQLAAVLVRVEAVVDVDLEARVHVPVVELAVEDEEHLVCALLSSALYMRAHSGAHHR